MPSIPRLHAPSRLSVGRYRCPSGGGTPPRPWPPRRTSRTFPTRPVPPPTDHPIPSPSPPPRPPCFLPSTLRVTSVADRPQLSRFTPIARHPSIPSFHLSHRGRRRRRRRRLSMTSRGALLFAPLNSYRSSRRRICEAVYVSARARVCARVFVQKHIDYQ